MKRQVKAKPKGNFSIRFAFLAQILVAAVGVVCLVGFVCLGAQRNYADLVFGLSMLGASVVVQNRRLATVQILQLLHQSPSHKHLLRRELVWQTLVWSFAAIVSILGLWGVSHRVFVEGMSVLG